MARKIIIACITIIVFLCVIVFGAAWHFSNQLINPKPYTCQVDHFVYCDGIGELSIPYKDVTFKNNENLTLKGWLVPGKSNAAIVMVHGITADRREGLRWVKALHKAGYTVLLFDLRNHGKSDKAKTAMGYYEKNDVIAAVDFLQSKGFKNIGVFGVSMGASTAIQAMASDKRIQAGVFEAAFANLSDLLAEIAKRDFGLPRFPIINAVMWVYSMRLGADANGINPEDFIGSISPRPVFIIHCDSDDYIAYHHGQRIFAKAKEPKIMWTAHCNKHARAWQSNPQEAEKKVVDFYNKFISSK
ncbi:MAG TPA: alpha/beta fold hydrolase [Spirochaetota bacterium]|nr:alpha/beta fold hydrolase [Spirochaetota bacterium]